MVSQKLKDEEFEIYLLEQKKSGGRIGLMFWGPFVILLWLVVFHPELMFKADHWVSNLPTFVRYIVELLAGLFGLAALFSNLSVYEYLIFTLGEYCKPDAFPQKFHKWVAIIMGMLYLFPAFIIKAEYLS